MNLSILQKSYMVYKKIIPLHELKYSKSNNWLNLIIIINKKNKNQFLKQTNFKSVIDNTCLEVNE